MSRLRTQLRSAKETYAGIRYPGDLSAEVLGTQRVAGRGWLIGFGFSAGGLAAALALVMVLTRQGSVPVREPGSISTDPTAIATRTAPSNASSPTPRPAPIPSTGESAVARAPLPYGMSEGIEYLDTMNRYVTLMEKFSRISKDPAAGATPKPATRSITPDDGDAGKAIEYFTEVFPQVKSEAVQRTLRILTSVSSSDD